VRRLGRIGLAVTLLAGLAALPLLARANHQPADDGNDTRGPLDVRTVQVKGTRAKPKWRVTTFGRWGPETIWDKGYGLVRLDAFGDEHYDHYALVRSNGFALQASLWRDRRRKDDVRVVKLHVARTNKRSFTVRVPLRRLNIPDARLFYRWYVQTIVVTSACPRSCFDRAPDDGAVTELIPTGTEPPPSPLPTPTLTVTPPASPSASR
jgi:hypothetical protein